MKENKYINTVLENTYIALNTKKKYPSSVTFVVHALHHHRIN